MVDLDGVLNNYNHYNAAKIPDMKEGAEEFLKTLSCDYKLILFTTRDKKLAKKWLIKNKIYKYFDSITNVKYPAYIYLDDRAVKFNGNYQETLEEIKKFDVYWKK